MQFRHDGYQYVDEFLRCYITCFRVELQIKWYSRISWYHTKFAMTRFPKILRSDEMYSFFPVILVMQFWGAHPNYSLLRCTAYSRIIAERMRRTSWWHCSKTDVIQISLHISLSDTTSIVLVKEMNLVLRFYRTGTRDHFLLVVVQVCTMWEVHHNFRISPYRCSSQYVCPLRNTIHVKAFLSFISCLP